MTASSPRRRPRTRPRLQTGNFAQGDVVDGFLALDPQYFGLAGVDIDGALLKALGLADSIAYAAVNDTAVDRSCPHCARAGSR